ncbi:TPA: aminotransferase class I/II-fold pyridoxal phosphate-dependent enzyme [Candidatus Woesearchaeota archaeon]|nr:aminotransferase class I/II-fold pyridoxal phosphate-dependent enzyme [Candidatus Woesearchaeota archaeon]
MTTIFKPAIRMSRLGTETAFAVSAECAAYAAKGNKVYPLHLGDMNIKTPQNIIDAATKAMNEGKTGYCASAGIQQLREALAEDIGKARGLKYSMENVAIQPGGKPSIGKFIMSVMEEGEEVLYPTPGYPIYESQIEFHKGKAVPYGYVEGEKGFKIDLEMLESLITKKTKALIYNNGQNPLACESDDKEMKEIAKLAIDNNLFVLSDEAYFDIRYSGKSKSIASLPAMQERTVILYTFSKKFAMTGWRLGAAIGPKEIIDQFIRLNVNDESCSTHFIQYAAIEALKGDQSGHKEIVKVLKQRRDVAVKLLNDIDGVRCYMPEIAFYLFPNVTAAVRRLGYKKGKEELARFRVDTLQKTGVSFTTRDHFGKRLPTEDQEYIRMAFSGINVDQIEEGLGKLKKFLEG